MIKKKKYNAKKKKNSKLSAVALHPHLPHFPPHKPISFHKRPGALSPAHKFVFSPYYLSSWSGLYLSSCPTDIDNKLDC
ncbi:hypothetical protein QTP88_017667 [Uroleucon formosanum]